MIFTAYLDESDTHGPNPTIIMASFLGHAYQWRRFETKISRMQKTYGFHIFHAKDFKGRRGEFTGWEEAKRAALIREFGDLVENCLTEGMAVHLEHERYLSEYKSPPIPNKMRLDSHYGACFRVCMARMMQLLRERGGRDTLHVVIERGHVNSGDCERIFHEFKTMSTQTMFSGLGTFTLQDKKSCLPLMLADLLGAVYSTVRAHRAAGKLGKEDFLIKTPKKGGIAFVELAPGALSDLKKNYELARQARVAHWRETRPSRTVFPRPLAGEP